MKTIITIILSIFLISLSSAFYAGETKIIEHELGMDNLIWTIASNSTPLTVLPEILINKTHFKIYFPSDMPPNSFTIIFLENQTNEIIKEIHHYSSGGGGSSGTKTIYKENKTIEYIEIPTYLDREIVTENKTETIIPKIQPKKIPIIFWLIIIGIPLFSCGYFIYRIQKCKNQEKE